MQIKRRYILAGLILLVTLAIAGGIVLMNYHSNPKSYDLEEIEKKTNVEDNLKQVNQFLAEKDQERIRSFVKRRGWQMEQTGSGLWYMINKQGGGPPIREGMYVKLRYEIRLLDGTLCYSSDSTGAKIFRVGHEGATRGLQEAMHFLHQGDHARIIVPPHMAHGLVGDGERIPARAILFYDVAVLEASRQKIRD